MITCKNPTKRLQSLYGKFGGIFMRNIRNKKSTQPQKEYHEVISVHQFSKIAMTFWLGGIWMVGLVVLPIIFRSLDPVSASNIAAEILNIVAYIGIICLLIALIEVIINHKFALIKTRRFWYILAMSSILIINYFAIFPIIHRLRDKLSMVAHQIINIQANVFDFWHSISAILYAVICIIGVLYLIEM